MSGFKFHLVNFKENSYPAIEGINVPDEFYIIKKGRVLRSTNNLPVNYSLEEVLEAGDFFGVISCMARRPHLHSIHVLEDSQFIVVRREEFKNLIVQNTPIALKIIRHFSKKLRFCDNIFAMLSFQMNQTHNTAQLFNLGEYFLGQRKIGHHAAYAYMRFLEYNPHHKNAGLARSRLELIKKHYTDEHKKISEDIYTLYDDNCIVFLENEAGHSLYIIQKGEVRITRIYKDKEVLLNILKQGDIFGEMAILEHKPRNANAFTNGPTTLLEVNSSNFEDMVKKYPEIASRIIELLSDRIWFVHQHISTVLISDPLTRIYDALYIHLLRDRIDAEAGGPHLFNLSWEDLLQFCGLDTHQSRSALFQFFIQNHIYSLEENHIYCDDIKDIYRQRNKARNKMTITKIRSFLE